MPSDHILWFQSIFLLEKLLRDDFEKNNDKEVLPEFAIIKLAYSILESEENIDGRINSKKKYPKLCDPGKLRKTFMREVSHDGPIKTNMAKKKNAEL